MVVSTTGPIGNIYPIKITHSLAKTAHANNKIKLVNYKISHFISVCSFRQLVSE